MSNYEEYSDEQLITLMQKGEQAAEDCLLNKYKAVVRRKVRTMYLIGGETDDLIQEGMLGLFKAVRDYKDDKDASFATFASLVIDRQLYNAIQSSNRKKHGPLNSYVSLSDEEFEFELKQFSGQSPEAIVIDRESTDGIQERIRQSLSAFENKVLNSYLEGNDYLKIAKTLGKEPKSIDNALQRIRSKVKACITTLK